MVFQNYFAEMPTPEEKIVELNSERASVEAQFREAGKMQDACRTRYAEIKGAIDVLTEMSSEENE